MRGELVYVAWPHSDSDTAKNFPALVLDGPDEQGDLILLKITGNGNYPDSLPLDTSDLAIGTMVKPSFIRTDRFLTIHLSEIKSRGKRVRDTKISEVLRRLVLKHSRAFSAIKHRGSL